MHDPTQIVQVDLTTLEGDPVVPAPGTAYRMLGDFSTETPPGCVVVVMTQAQYNDWENFNSTLADVKSDLTYIKNTVHQIRRTQSDIINGH